MSQSREEKWWQGAIDLDALLVALVLVPHSYPRNKFYHLYRSPEAQRVRRRAATIRGIVAELLHEASELRVESDEQAVVLHYRLAEVGVSRQSILSHSEHALLCHCVARARGNASPWLQKLGTPRAAEAVAKRVASLLPLAMRSG
jgi:hypothetical protein